MSGDDKNEALQTLLRAAFTAKKGRRVSRQTEFDFVFHMTDWLDDLVALSRLYRSPGGYSAAEARRVVDGLLIHGVGHIVEAARLWDHFSDPFGSPEARKAAVPSDRVSSGPKRPKLAEGKPDGGRARRTRA